MSKYVPKQGDIIYLDFNPQSGREQMGRRPALVISNNDFNSFFKNGVIVCPITNTDRNLPFHIKLPSSSRATGVVMCEQVKALDIVARNAQFYDEAPNSVVHQVLETVKLFF